MSIALVVTAGYGNGTFSGTIPFVVTRGYSISTVIPSVVPTADGIQVPGVFGDGVSVSSDFGSGATVTSSFGTGAKVDGDL